MLKNIISCRSHCFKEYEIFGYPHLYEIGIRYLEIFNPGQKGVDNIKNILNSYSGMHIKSIQTTIPIKEIDPSNKMREDVFDIAKELNATHIFVPLNPEGVKEEDWIKRLRLVGDVAQEYGLIVTLETHEPLVTNGDIGCSTMKKINHPAIKINFDPANIYFLNKDPDLKTELRKVLKYVASVHLKESNKKFKTKYFPGLGEGEGCINFKEVFTMLNNRMDPCPFNGPFTIEIEGIYGEKKQTLDDLKRRVTNSVEYLKHIGVIS